MTSDSRLREALKNHQYDYEWGCCACSGETTLTYTQWIEHFIALLTEQANAIAKRAIDCSASEFCEHETLEDCIELGDETQPGATGEEG